VVEFVEVVSLVMLCRVMSRCGDFVCQWVSFVEYADLWGLYCLSVSEHY